MPRDSQGNYLKAGDVVLLRCTVVSVFIPALMKSEISVQLLDPRELGAHCPSLTIESTLATKEPPKIGEH